MKARLETHDGKVTLKVYYDPALCNRGEAIAAGLASFGLKEGQAGVSALPFEHGKGKVLFFTDKKQKQSGLESFRNDKKSMAR